MKLMRVRRLFAGEPVARFGTPGPGGRPHLIPVPFALIDDGDDGVVVCTIDEAPRSIGGFARLHDISSSPRVSFLADGSGVPAAGPFQQWWVQADAVAEVLRRGDDPRWQMAVDALTARYRRYRHHPPAGPIIWATVVAWSGWTAPAEAAA